MRCFVCAVGLILAFQEADANSFEEGFLGICGDMVLTGDAPPPQRMPGMQIRAVEDASGHVCHFFETVEIVPGTPVEAQRDWLTQPDRVAQSFDTWITQMRAHHDLIDAPECVISFTKEDAVTKRLYAHAVKVGESGRAMTVEITRRQ